MQMVATLWIWFTEEARNKWRTAQQECLVGHKVTECAQNSLLYIMKWKICALRPLHDWLYLIFFCVVVLAECFLNGRSMRTGQKRSVNMITPTKILMKRTCELFQDWSWGATANVSQWFDSSSKYMGLLWKDQKNVDSQFVEKTR